ncbi:MAG: hypothetical protein ACOYJQ_11405, partial [Pseudochelatococcus sp.]|uniref:hypothetical protein n=1 Tax=Pseudochelatococcus sp. TaxID=2020869 RepID=UPI003D8F7FBA
MWLGCCLKAEGSMNSLSISFILRTIVGVLVAASIVQLSLDAASAWRRTVELARIEAVTRITSYLFDAVHNLRADSANTRQALVGDGDVSGSLAQIQAARAAEMPAIEQAIAVLQTADLPASPELAANLKMAHNSLKAQQEQVSEVLRQSRANRPADLGDQYAARVAATIDVLTETSLKLTHSVRLQDSFTDRMLDIKSFAWLARAAAGDAALITLDA